MIASLYQRGSVALASFFTLEFSEVLGCSFSCYLLAVQQRHLNSWTTIRHAQSMRKRAYLCARQMIWNRVTVFYALLRTGSRQWHANCSLEVSHPGCRKERCKAPLECLSALPAGMRCCIAIPSTSGDRVPLRWITGLISVRNEQDDARNWLKSCSSIVHCGACECFRDQSCEACNWPRPERAGVLTRPQGRCRCSRQPV